MSVAEFLGVHQFPPDEPAPTSAGLNARFHWYRRMASDNPVALIDEARAIWGVFRYDDVLRILDDVTTFSNVLPPRSDDDALQDSMLRTDPPRHRQLRGLIGPTFTSRRIATLRDRIQELSEVVVGQLAQRGEIDVVTDVARVIPTLVIAELLGIEPSMRADFARWSAAFLGSLLSMPDAAQAADLRDMDAFFIDIIAYRRRNPGDDLIGVAATAELDGVRLTTRQLAQFCKLLLIAGTETTTHLIGNMVLCLQHLHRTAQRLRADHSLLPRFVTEVLRYLTPLQTAPRAARIDVELRGQVIPAGAVIYPFIGAANRDSTWFVSPDRLDIDRDGKPLTFGHGIHYCLGAALAQLEGEIVLNTMLRMLPEQWHGQAQVMAVPTLEICGLSHLPLILDWPAV